MSISLTLGALLPASLSAYFSNTSSFVYNSQVFSETTITADACYDVAPKTMLDTSGVLRVTLTGVDMPDLKGFDIPALRIVRNSDTVYESNFFQATRTFHIMVSHNDTIRICALNTLDAFNSPVFLLSEISILQEEQAYSVCSHDESERFSEISAEWQSSSASGMQLYLIAFMDTPNCIAHYSLITKSSNSSESQEVSSLVVDPSTPYPFWTTVPEIDTIKYMLVEVPLHVNELKVVSNPSSKAQEYQNQALPKSEGPWVPLTHP